MIPRLLLPLLLATGAVAAAAQQSSAGRAADRFSLDLPTPTPTSTAVPEPVTDKPVPPAAEPAATLPAPVLPETADVTGGATAAAADVPATGGARVAYTLDTPIADLIANPATKAVLDKDLPGISSDENLAKFDRLGLKQFQPLTGGQLTDAMLAKVASDLAATGGAVLAVPTGAPTGNRRSRDDSR